MAKESINGANGFYLKPGGIQEQGLPTDLPADTYSQVSGIEDSGVVQRMPGKRLVTKYADKVLAIAPFGGALFIQYGNTLILYPDACAVSPSAVETSPPNPGGGGETVDGLLIAVHDSIFNIDQNTRLVGLIFQTINTTDNTRTDIHTWTLNDLLVNPGTTPTQKDDYVPTVNFAPYLQVGPLVGNYNGNPIHAPATYGLTMLYHNEQGDFSLPPLVAIKVDEQHGWFLYPSESQVVGSGWYFGGTGAESPVLIQFSTPGA